MPAPKPSSRPRRRHAAINLAAASRIANVILTARSAGSEQGTGSLNPVTGELVECPFELAHQWPQRAVVFAQEVEDFLGFGSLGEGGVTAQIAKHDDDLAVMAFEDFLVAVRDD